MSPAFEIQIRGTGPLFTDPQIAARFDTEVQAALHELAALGQRLVVEGAPHGISSGGGGLRGSIFSEVRGVPARREALIASSVFYAPIVEVGRHPGRYPPIGPIQLWVTRKLQVPPGEAASVAFLVSRKIGLRGTQGAHMFERAMTQLEPIAQRRFQELGDRIVQLLNTESGSV
jgi:hypothetical protein